MRTRTLRGTTWERRYQKAIRESIHLAHLRVGRSRQRYGQKSQCSESARQLRFPCSQPAIQCRTLIKDKRSPETHNHTGCTDFYYHSQWPSLGFTRVSVHKPRQPGQGSLKPRWEGAQRLRRHVVFFTGFYSEIQTCTVGAVVAAVI